MVLSNVRRFVQFVECAHMHSLSTSYRKGFCDNADSTAIKLIIYSTHCVYLADIDDCVGVTCSGHGTCVDGVNSHSCNCNAGFTGYMCETSMLFITFFKEF
jgi:hypothetical protein